MAHILIVEDYEDNRTLYSCYLEMRGHRVSEACDGEEGVRTAGAVLPDVIVMDLSLPLIDGWEATRLIRANPRTRHIPVIALTGHAYPNHEAEARRVGAQAFLTKPCKPEALAAAIDELLAESRVAMAAAQA